VDDRAQRRADRGGVDARVPAPRPTADDPIGPLGAAAAHGARPAGVALATGPAPAAVAPMAARLVVRPTEAFGNGSVTMHGGMLFACTDLAAAGLAGALGPQPALDDTTSVRMNLLRPAVLDEPVIFTARLVNRGRTLSVYRVTSHGAAGRPYTVATVTRASRPWRRAGPRTPGSATRGAPIRRVRGSAHLSWPGRSPGSSRRR
jgi:uncharacterized protein (TIGR00369 family)